MKSVTLLVCLSPSAAPEIVTELSFYYLVQPITPVRNIKMVCNEGQIKAFVQVKDESAAESVIDSLHQKTTDIGKMKVFLSHKKFVNYERSLDEILQMAYNDDFKIGCTIGKESIPNIRKDKTYSSSELNQGHNSLSLKLDRERDEKTKSTLIELGLKHVSGDFANFNDDEMVIRGKYNKVEDNLERNVKNKDEKPSRPVEFESDSVFAISITNDDPITIKSKTISALFGEFGRIIKKSLDSTKMVWTIKYDTELASSAARSKLRKPFHGYRLAEPVESHFFNKRELTTKDNLYFNIIQPQSQSESSDKHTLTHKVDYCVLKVTDRSQKTTIDGLCRLIAVKRIPLQILEAYENKYNHYFFLVTFKNYEDSRFIHNYLKNQVRDLQMNVTFAEIGCK